MDNTLIRLTPIFQKIFSKPDLKIGTETTANNISNWDSLTNIQLLVAVQKEFQIKFSAAEAVRMKNVGDLIEAIQNKQVLKK